MGRYIISKEEMRRVHAYERTLCNPHVFARLISDIASINTLSQSPVAWSPAYADVATWLWIQNIPSPSCSFFEDMEDETTTSLSQETFLNSLWDALGTPESRERTHMYHSVTDMLFYAGEYALERRAGIRYGRVYVLMPCMSEKTARYALFIMKALALRGFSNMVLVVFGLPLCAIENFSLIARTGGWNTAVCESDFFVFDAALSNFIRGIPDMPGALILKNTRRTWFSKNILEIHGDQIVQTLIARLQRVAYKVGIKKITIQTIDS